MNPSNFTTDTSEEAAAVQLEGWRRMTPQQRISKMCSLSGRVKIMALDAIRRRHPQMSESDVRLMFIELTYGKRLADDVRLAMQEVNE